MADTLDLAKVEVVGGPLVLASDPEVDDLEARLGTTFPDGYREFVTRLGEGALNVLVRVYPPWRVLAELDVSRGSFSAYWLWESDDVPFGQDQAMESISIADTIDGDMVVFRPSDPARIIVLPRQDERLVARGPNLLETIEWICRGGTGSRTSRRRTFSPFDSRLEGMDGARLERPSVSASDAAAPALDRPPREVLLAYFAELAAVEAWATEQAGGPDAFMGDEPPDTGDEEDFAELLARSEAVHVRYCTPELARALGGSSVTVSATPKHDGAAIRILEEKETRPGRVVIRTVEGSDIAFRRQYALERSGREWRISSQNDLGLDDTRPLPDPKPKHGPKGFWSSLQTRTRKPGR